MASDHAAGTNSPHRGPTCSEGKTKQIVYAHLTGCSVALQPNDFGIAKAPRQSREKVVRRKKKKDPGGILAYTRRSSLSQLSLSRGACYSVLTKLGPGLCSRGVVGYSLQNIERHGYMYEASLLGKKEEKKGMKKQNQMPSPEISQRCTQDPMSGGP